MAVSSNEKMQN